MSALRLRSSIVFIKRKFLNAVLRADFSAKIDENSKKNIVFLGSPSCASVSLKLLFAESQKPESIFRIVNVVTQPMTSVKTKLICSPVHQLSNELGIPVLTPVSAKNVEFLNLLDTLNVDLFVTAAYGNYLPKRFLSIAKFGTVNIHPSLLPKYRGAAPVQRCLENGDIDTAVSVLYTVSKMDAGPILSQTPIPLNGNEKSSEVLSKAFDIGARALIDLMPAIFDGTVVSTPQDEVLMTHASKISSSEGLVNFATQTASEIHNKCRGFSDWPGIYSYFSINHGPEVYRVKIITTEVISTGDGVARPTPQRDITFVKHQDRELLAVPCCDGSVLGVAELQFKTKKIMSARAYYNGRPTLPFQWIDVTTVPEAIETLKAAAAITAATAAK